MNGTKTEIMQKHIILFIMAVILSATAASAKDNGNILKLWDEYRRYEKLDRPKDQADVLLKIKSAAKDSHRAWDYYDASQLYVQVCSSMNRHQRDELQSQMDRDIAQFGCPVMLYFHKRFDMETEDKIAFAQQNEALLQGSYNPDFYKSDFGLALPGYYEILPGLLKNDYDYILWSIYFCDGATDKANSLIHRRFDAVYPFAELLAYCEIPDIRTTYYCSSERLEAMKRYASRYADKAVSLMAAHELLRCNLMELDRSGADEEQFRELDRRCDSLIARTAQFKKSKIDADRIIAAACSTASELKKELRSKGLNAVVEDDTLRISLVNLDAVKVEIFRSSGKSPILTISKNNDRRSFHVADTISLPLDFMEDGDYEIKCSRGKIKTDISYRKHSISIAMENSIQGKRFYAADFKTGEPVASYTLTITDDSGNKLCSTKMSSSEGFAIPYGIFISKDKRVVYAQAEYRDAQGKLHSSDIISMKTGRAYNYPDSSNPGTSCMILLDRSAFNPGETVHFKAIAYTGTYSFSTVAKGTRLQAVISDPEGNEFARLPLTTDEFGAASGEFFLEKGHLGGNYTISVSKASDTIGSRSLRVDEFVLPSFELKWDKDERIYFHGDRIHASGTVSSYNGHSLSNAKARYEVSLYSDVLQSGNLVLDKDGAFDIYYTGSDNIRYGSYVVKITVTDASGETLSFEKSISCRSECWMDVDFTDTDTGRFTLTDGHTGTILIRGDVLNLDYSIPWSSSDSRPGLTLKSTILKDGKPVIEQDTRMGRNTMDISKLKSGAYTLLTESCAYTDSGREIRSEREDTFIVLRDNTLPGNIKSCFREGTDGELSVSVGSGDAPLWVVACLYGDAAPLEGRLVKMDKGTLGTISFERKPSYPAALSIKLLFFRDSQSFSYTYNPPVKEAAADTWNISFTRFLDTTAPVAEYRFCLKGPVDAQYAVGIFDKASETVRGNRWHSVSPASRPVASVRINFVTGSYDSSFGYGTARPMFKYSRMMMSSNVMMDAASGSFEEEEMTDTKAAPEGAAEAEDIVVVRKEFNGTLAWEPALRSDENGEVSFTFKTSDKLSTYVVQVFAHDKSFNNKTISKEMTVTLPVTISLIQPSYLYSSDRYMLRVGLSNSTSAPISGKVQVRFVNGKDYKDRKRIISKKDSRISIPQNSSAAAEFEIAVPDINSLGILVSFTPDSGSDCADAVFVEVPVKAPVQTVTESHSALLKDDASRSALTKILRNSFVNISGRKAESREISILQMLSDAIPKKLSYSDNSLVSLLEALYANVLAGRLPQGYNAGRLSAREEEEITDKILACRNSDGGFAWMSGLYSSPAMTALLLEWCARMGEECNPRLSAVIPAAVEYLDKYLTGKGTTFEWRGRLSLPQYLYARSFYPHIPICADGADRDRLEELQRRTREYLIPQDSRGLQGQILPKARRLATLENLYESEDNSFAASLGIGLFQNAKLRSSIAKDAESLSQYAVEHSSGGYYFPNAVQPWGGLLESDLYAHVILCELMDSNGKSDIAEGIRLWTMIQKESWHWENDFAYIRALECVLKGSDATLQTKVLVLRATAALPLNDIQPAGNGMSITREYFIGDRKLSEGENIKVGDIIKAVYTITSDESRSFVRIRIPRNAALNPVDGNSGITYSHTLLYRNVLSDATEYWTDALPEGTTKLSEEFYITRAGTFRTATPEAVSLFADHYRANGGFEPAMTVR